MSGKTKRLLVPASLLLASLAVAHTCLWWWTIDPSSSALLGNLQCGNFQRCMLGPGVMPSKCCRDFYDVDKDGDVDMRDLSEYLACMADIYRSE